MIEPTGAATATTSTRSSRASTSRSRRFPLRAVGRKALAAALSDLAAMGAEPGEAYVALGAPEELGEEELLELADGLAEVAEREGVAVAGGDVTRAPALTSCVDLRRLRAPRGRAGDPRGRPPGRRGRGDRGARAAPRAALALLGERRTRSGSTRPESLLARQLDPRPRLEAGRALARRAPRDDRRQRRPRRGRRAPRAGERGRASRSSWRAVPLAAG